MSENVNEKANEQIFNSDNKNYGFKSASIDAKHIVPREQRIKVVLGLIYKATRQLKKTQSSTSSVYEQLMHALRDYADNAESNSLFKQVLNYLNDRIFNGRRLILRLNHDISHEIDKTDAPVESVTAGNYGPLHQDAIMLAKATDNHERAVSDDLIYIMNMDSMTIVPIGQGIVFKNLLQHLYKKLNKNEKIHKAIANLRHQYIKIG